MRIKIEGTGVQMAYGRGIGSAPAIFWGICPVLAVWNTLPPLQAGGCPREWAALSSHLVTGQSLKPPDLGTGTIWISQGSTLLTFDFSFKSSELEIRQRIKFSSREPEAMITMDISPCDSGMVRLVGRIIIQ